MSEMPKPKNKQTLTIVMIVGAVFIIWLFLRNRTISGNNAENQTIINPDDGSWLDKLLGGLAAAGAPFNINIPEMLGYVPKDYPINIGGNNYVLPRPQTDKINSSCSFCMKTPEEPQPASQPAPAPALVLPPPQPLMSFGDSRAVATPYNPPALYPWSTGRM